MPYTPEQYWSRLHDRHDLSAVGQSGLPSAMNRELYRILARNLRRFLRRNGVDRIGPAAFEVGAGSGYWIDLWRELGATRVDGCDLVGAAVEDLNARFGASGRFRVADIGSDDVGPDAYDFVAVMNVLLHVTDDAKFEHALATIARLVRPGGRLLLTEPMLYRERFAKAYSPEASSRARPLRRYVEPLEAEGLRLQAVAAGTAIGNNPIEGRWPWVFWTWRGAWVAASMPARIRPQSARWVGAMLYALDPAVMAMRAAPSSKFALFNRPR
jgi:SAM-dependent methyltransferase